jgi:hypothetical protein
LAGYDTLDIHSQLHDYQTVLEHLIALEAEGSVKEYFDGHNEGGRWIFQILTTEFVDELANLINTQLNHTQSSGPVLEVMAGDGRLAVFLRPKVMRDVVATDAKDGRYNIAYPKWVERLDATESIRRYDPSVLIISWEPYLSNTGLELVETGLPLIWIGNPKMCGHPDLQDKNPVRLETQYALSRHDSFSKRQFRSQVLLFNMSSEQTREP